MTYEDLLALPETTVSANLACYGTPIKYGDWQGVKLSDILNAAGLDQTVLSTDFGAQDGYSVSIPIDTAMRQDVIVAYAMNGVPLSETLRLVIPGANGNVWIAMITRISMSNVPLSDSMSTPGQALYNQNQYINRIATNAMPQSSPQQLQPTPSASNANSEPTPTHANSDECSSTVCAEGDRAGGLKFQFSSNLFCGAWVCRYVSCC